MPNTTEHITVSLLDRNGNLPKISGLNWGQREGRERNQAYIKLPSEVYHSNFFPPVGVRFTLETDDGRTFICTRAQASGKAIEAPENNSLLGIYFRGRLGLNRGVLVEKQHLVDYGRTDVDFYRISENTYKLDFSV